MVSKDDRPAGGGRPSLLSTEQQGAAEGRSVLGALDGKAAKPAKPAKAAGPNRPAARAAAAKHKPGRGLALWGALGAGVIALAGGTLAWMASVPDDESVAAVSAPPALPAPRAAVAPAPAAQSDVSTAAILQDTPSPPQDKQPSLKEMLAAPSAKVAARPDPLTQALERPSSKPADVPKTEKTRTAAPDKEPNEARKKPAKDKPAKDKAARDKAAKDKQKAAPPPKPVPQDKDATVLAALMAHVQPNSSMPKKSTPAQQLKACRQYNAAGAEQCRARLCSNIAKNERECKVRAKGKASADA